MDKIILASASPRRKMLLKQIGIPFDVVVSDVEEEVKLALTPEELVIELSKQKAINVANSLGEGFLVIGADTIVVFEGKILGKPKDKEDAYKMLSMLQGNCHEVYTGVTIIRTKDKQIESIMKNESLYERNFSQSIINKYIDTKEPLDKAEHMAFKKKVLLLIR